MKLSCLPVENVNEIHDCCKMLYSHKFSVNSFACVIMILVIITIMIMIMSNNNNNNLSLFYFG